MRILLLFLLAVSAWAADFYVDPIMNTAGPYQTITNYQEHVTTSGSPSAGTSRRAYLGFPLSSSNTLQVYLPPGVTGSCSHGPCNFIAYGSATGGACNWSDAWPQTIPGKVGIRMLGCVDFSTTGTIQYIATADPLSSAESPYAGIEGSQTIQGSCGPGPITFRNNDMGFTGNPMHFADDCNIDNNPSGITTYHANYWIYRNRFHPYWPGMNHWQNPGRDGNSYGSRNQIMEWKGGDRITVEGNNFLGNYNDATQAHQGSPIVFRNVNQGISNTTIANNLFQHVAAGFLINDYNSGITTWAPAGTAGMVQNNVMLDVNVQGPDTAGINVSLSAGSGSYASSVGFQPYSGQGRLMQGPGLVQGISWLNNTIPDVRGAFPVFDTTSTVANGGLTAKNNFFSFNDAVFTYGGVGMREDEGGNGWPGTCATNTRGFALLTCAWPNNIFSGNVLLSSTFTASQLTTDGWGTNNTALGSGTALTTIWPKYNLNPCGATPAWTCDLLPYVEMVRLPAGSAYQGKGADITQLKQVMGYLENPQAAFDASNNLVVTWLAPDTVASTVDVAAAGQLYGTFTRIKTDVGGPRARKVTIPASNFTAHANYDVRINGETMAPILHVRSN